MRVYRSSGCRSCAAYVVGHEVATTAVLTPPAQKRRSKGRPSTTPPALRSSGDDAKAAHLRQPLLSDTASCEVFFSSHFKDTSPAPAFGVAARLWSRRPRSGAERGHKGPVV